MSYVDPRVTLTRLSARDLAILDDIERFRLLTTRLLQRLHFPITSGEASPGHASAGAATKATMRVMTRLSEHGVVTHLAQRIGGVRHGSQGFIWQMTSTGANLQRFRRGETSRRRYVEPSSLFTDHTLAVAALAVAARELACDRQLEVLRLQTEPECWRDYAGPHGIAQTLKPDLHLVSATPAFEDHLYIEADLGSEHLPRIITKCRAYAAYHATGIEQRSGGIFPAVLWVAHNQDRAEQIHRAIRAESSLPQPLFTVITAEEFPRYLTGGTDPPPPGAATPSNTPRKEEPTHGINP